MLTFDAAKERQHYHATDSAITGVMCDALSSDLACVSQPVTHACNDEAGRLQEREVPTAQQTRSSAPESFSLWEVSRGLLHWISAKDRKLSTAPLDGYAVHECFRIKRTNRRV